MDSPEPFLYRVALHVLVSLASAVFVDADMSLEVEAARESQKASP